MQTHTSEKVVKLLEEHLPHGYAKKAKEKLLEQTQRKVSETWVRQVKNFQAKDLQIVNILLIIAKENKAVAEAELSKTEKLTS